MTEIAQAYITLTTKMPGVKGDIERALGGSDVKSAVGNAGKGFGSVLMDGLNSIGKVGALAVGGTIAAGVGTALVKGFNRLDALDQAEAKLSGLGHSAKTVDQIMDNALNSVRGTAFGMDEAATVAANAVAAGIKPGVELERTLKAVADASTIAGTDMASMGAIFNKAAASNKVQMDIINQLHDAGVPALTLLADQMGVTAEEAAKMASEGKINFETFQAAMEAGMGGAALESGSTFSGAMDNVMASLGRMGAGLLSGVFPDMKEGLSGLLDAMAPLEEVAKNVGAAIGEFVTFIGDNISWIGPLATGIAIVVGAVVLWTAVQWLLNAALTANPIGLIIVAIGLLVGAIIWLVQNWDAVVAWLSDVWDGFVSWFTDVMDGFLAWWNGLWTAVWEWIVSVWNGIVTGITNYFNMLWLGLQIIGQAISNWWNGLWNGIASFFKGIWDGILAAINNVKKGFETVFNTIGNIIRGAFEGAVGFVKGIINGIIDAVNGVIGGINSVGGAIGGALGIEVNIPRIPRLAQGGIVTASAGGTLAVIGEGGRDEAVVPLPDGWRNGGFGGLADGQSLTLVVEGQPLTAVVRRTLTAQDRAQESAIARGSWVR